MADALCVAIIDDDEIKRDTFCDEVELVNWKAMPLSGPFSTIPSLIEMVVGRANVAVCDHHLVRNYAPFNGAQTVAALYNRKFPAVLVTKYEKAQMDDIRAFRRGIPVLLTPTEADPDTLARAWETCRDEFEGRYNSARKPWRTMIFVDDVSENDVWALLPGWNSEEIIRFPRSVIPSHMSHKVERGTRLFAQVNKGAEDQSELYFQDFEFVGA